MKHTKYAFGLLGLAFLLAGATPTVRADTVDLSTLAADCTVTNGTILTGTLAEPCMIAVADGATVTLNNATILGTNSASCQWAGLSCEGDATIVLSGANTVRGFHSSFPALHVPADKTLTIRGAGSLDASGNGNSAGIGGGFQIACGNIVIESGTITAAGGFGAGIGGGYDAPCGEIHIAGGNVSATGGNGSAGIGGGYNPDGSVNGLCGDIAITGGTVTATGADHGAGIGGGNKVPCGDILLDGGIICATGGDYASGIGGGWLASCGNVTIVGGSVTAMGGDYAAGIGAGNRVSCGDILLAGGLIRATGGIYGAGIGGAWKGTCGDITIESSIDRITATMGESATPIGNGYGATCGTVSIADGLKDVTWGDTRTITSWNGFLADLTHDAAALDGMTLCGTLTGKYKVSIADGATVTLEGVSILGEYSYEYPWAGITCEGNATIILSGENTIRGFYEGYPGIYVPSGKTLTIRGSGALTAIGSQYGAGIGGGQNTPCGNIVIEGGEITATGGTYAAGIGGGSGGFSPSCGDITIGAEITCITATMGSYGHAPIGGSPYTTSGRVSISDSLEQIKSNNDYTLTLRPKSSYTITWLNDAGGVIDTTEVAEGVVPTHAEPVSTRTVAAPYRYVFAGWTPEPVAATNDATYAATFDCVADLSLLTGDWSPDDGDILLPGATPYAVTIPAGATVTIDGVALSAEDFSPSAPVFADGGSAFIAGFAPGGDGTWSLEAYGDLASGTAKGVTADMVQVYVANTVEGLATAEPLASGVTLKDAQNVVKATLEVAPPTTSETQFFRVRFISE